MISIDLSHPLVVGTLLALFAGLPAALVLGFLTVRDLRQDVLPHFKQSPPGHPDVSLPGRLTAVETAVDDLREGDRKLRNELISHMKDETQARSDDAKNRSLEALRFNDSLSRVHERIDALITRADRHLPPYEHVDKHTDI